MPFNTYEKSTFSGQPVQFYEFSRASGDDVFYWRYNTSDRDIKLDGNSYTAIPISDSGIRLNGEPVATEFQATMPVTTEFAQDFRFSGTVPSDTVFLRVYRVHAADITDLDGADPSVDTNTYRLIWIGTVTGITQTDDINSRVTCSTLAASFRRGGLRYGWQKSCPHILYGSQCKVDKEDFRTDGVVTAVSSTEVSADEWDALDDGWFSGGFIEYVMPSGVTERRMVVSHSGATLVLLGFVVGMSVADTVKAFAGCDRRVETCQSKFDNLDNMGGFPHSPGRNPFDGQPVY